MDTEMDLKAVEATLGYTFTDAAWLVQALTHPSYDQRAKSRMAYERLEYLGDAVLELVVSREMFSLYPKADEGLLTKMRSAVVSRQHLSSLCDKLGWCEQLAMNPQMVKSGGRSQFSVMANTFESVIGAVMMDAGYAAARKVALALLGPSIAKAESMIDVNTKGVLLETLQAINNEGPTYAVSPVNPETPDVGPFRAVVLWNGSELGSAEGSSKHKAQMAAAKAALEARLWEH